MKQTGLFIRYKHVLNTDRIFFHQPFLHPSIGSEYILSRRESRYVHGTPRGSGGSGSVVGKASLASNLAGGGGETNYHYLLYLN